MTKITITAGNVTMDAELNDSPTAQAVIAILPIKNTGTLWGDEIYFSIPVHMDAEPEANAQVEVGALAYWPPGNAFCIFFGPTPASSGAKPEAASPVNVIGHVLGDATKFRTVSNGANIKIEHAS